MTLTSKFNLGDLFYSVDTFGCSIFIIGSITIKKSFDEMIATRPLSKEDGVTYVLFHVDQNGEIQPEHYNHITEKNILMRIAAGDLYTNIDLVEKAIRMRTKGTIADIKNIKRHVTKKKLKETLSPRADNK